MQMHGARRSRMIGPEDRVTTDQCRERRRQRIERRRANGGIRRYPTHTSNQAGDSNESREGQGGEQVVVASTVVAPAVMPPLIQFGTVSIAGRTRKMEDAFSVHLDLCRPQINGGRPVHFFGVFDGHGGSHVSKLCSEQMHVIMREELMSAGDGVDGGWWGAIKRCFRRMDELAMTICPCGYIDGCICRRYDKTRGGSTAVVALLTQATVFVANCGDSRAVLGRGGRAIPLSKDHKPDREDELARIRAVGGKIIDLDTPRVEGVLAMTRAIGDKRLKPSVSAEPEIGMLKRGMDDISLIIASDGLWDVITNELACEIAQYVLTETQGHHVNLEAPYFRTPSESAAAILTRLALGRESVDNISVIVVDLSK